MIGQNYAGYQPDYAGLGEGDYGSPGMGGAGAGFNASQYAPYLQMLLSGIQGMHGASPTQQVAQQAQQASPGVRLPSQPGSQSGAARAMRAGGQTALGMIPNIGPVPVGGIAQALGGAYNQAKDQGAVHDYLRRTLAMNPDLAPPGDLNLEDVPQHGHNDALRHAFQAASGIVASYFGGPLGGLTAGAISHAKEKQEAEQLAKQQKAVEARNTEKIAQYNDKLAQDAQAGQMDARARQAGPNRFAQPGQMDPAAMQRMLPFLLHLLGPQAGQYLRGLMPQGPRPPQPPYGGAYPQGRL